MDHFITNRKYLRHSQADQEVEETTNEPAPRERDGSAIG